MSNSKWDEIHKKAQEENLKSDVEKEVENKYDSEDTEAERLYIRNTQIGGAVDTKEELDAQKHNLGPKDTPIENDEPNTPKP
ncbi:hypothetical protein Lgra_1642 [Legionella gratiana]|uniref:Uncharacterized protein n=1 Tax=Legionella gratiana TaxID=45066 RepID=A0A378J926_9GAMM|nr:hypothetical protein [Legionella gratiana]KTD10676.1 hypothetical protein Lgra_1642 [Legionella gratiana]STX43678.1 Uncharacterised protein [Legionella gratiana]